MNLTSFYFAFHDPIWIALLSTALFFPVRQLIWVLYVRKKQKSQKIVSDEEKKSLKKRATFTAVFLCIVFVFVAIQRLELMLLFMALMAMKVQRAFNFDYRPILALGVFAFFTWLISFLSIDKDNAWYVLENFESPRVIFLVEAVFELFESNFWGAGWGTIGSHSAADVANVYEYNAMKDLWWVQLGQYFYDTYWPHVIGETGIPGYFLLLLSMTFMVCALKRPEASLLLFLLLLTSALSSNAQSLYHLTIFGWFITLLESDPNGWKKPKTKPVLTT